MSPFVTSKPIGSDHQHPMTRCDSSALVCRLAFAKILSAVATVLAILAIVCSAALSGCAGRGQIAALDAGSLLIPGTGVTGTPPAGVHLLPLGSFLSDDSGEIVIMVVEGRAPDDAKAVAEEERMYAALYPDPHEEIRHDGLTGTLYKRTREKNGGGWDGWELLVVRGERRLLVKATYTGKTPGVFEKLKDFMATLGWDEKRAHAEVAFGARFPLLDLPVADDVIAGLNYSRDGKPEGAGLHVEVTAFPIPQIRAQRGTQADCSKIVVVGFKDKQFSGAHPVAYPTWLACDAWSIDPEKPLKYSIAIVRPDGVAIIATAHDDAGPIDARVDHLRTALLGAQMLRDPRKMP